MCPPLRAVPPLRLGHGAAFFDPLRVEKIGRNRAKKGRVPSPIGERCSPQIRVIPIAIRKSQGLLRTPKFPLAAQPRAAFSPCALRRAKTVEIRNVRPQTCLSASWGGKNGVLMEIHSQNFLGKCESCIAIRHTVWYNQNKKGRCLRCPQKAQM